MFRAAKGYELQKNWTINFFHLRERFVPPTLPPFYQDDFCKNIFAN